MKKLNRILALAFALMTLLSMVVSPAYAADFNAEAVPVSTEVRADMVEDTAGVKSGGVLLAIGVENISLQGDVYCTLKNANSSCDVDISIAGAPNTTYYCVLVNETTNQSWSLSDVQGDGQRVVARTLSYAPAGVYRLHIVAWNGDATTVFVVFRLYD